MAAEIAEPTAKKPGLIGRLMKGLLYLVIAVILAAAGFAAGYVYFANPLSPQKDVLSLIEKANPDAASSDAKPANPDEPQKVAKPTPNDNEYVTSYYTFHDPLTTNLANSHRILQVTVGISTQYDAKVFEHVEANKVALQSDMLAVASAFTEQDLADAAGRQKLGDALKEAINKRLEKIEGFGGIEDVFFPTFILQ